MNQNEQLVILKIETLSSADYYSECKNKGKIKKSPEIIVSAK